MRCVRDVVEAAATAGERGLELRTPSAEQLAPSATTGGTGRICASSAGGELRDRPSSKTLSANAQDIARAARRAIADRCPPDGRIRARGQVIERAIPDEPQERRYAHRASRRRARHGSPLRADAAPSASRRCSELLDEAENDRAVAHASCLISPGCDAMQGRFDEARALLRRSTADLPKTWGCAFARAGSATSCRARELLAGDPRRRSASSGTATRSCERWAQAAISRRRPLSSPVAARPRIGATRPSHSRRADAQRSRPDSDPHVDVRSRIDLVGRGEPARAGRLETAKSAVEPRSEPMRSTSRCGLAALALASARLRTARRRSSAARRSTRSLALYDAKGNVIAARQAEALLAEVAI